MKIAVVGSGISGLVAARRLHSEHDLTVFEAADYVGGHTATVDVELGGARHAVDTGFIVFNLKTYPRFVELLRELGVAWQPSTMSFSARSDAEDVEYNGTSLDTLFAQRRNLLRPRFWRMVREILRFYREAPELLEAESDGPTLGRYLEQGGYSREFVDWHIVPMAAAIWSARPGGILDMPARYLVRFFDNHGFLQVDDRPEWQVVRGGSREYVRPLIEPFADRIRLSTPVRQVSRVAGSVELVTAGGERELFDRVILATHADQSLRLLADATPAEREVLSAFEYQENETVLHTDPGVMPRRRRAWASWNYHIGRGDRGRANVTYWMNELQGLRDAPDFFVTLNSSSAIDPARVLRAFTYHHPIYDSAAVAAQQRHAEIDGASGVHFCGAYWGYGFHEDGVKSGLAVCRNLEREGVPA